MLERPLSAVASFASCKTRLARRGRSDETTGATLPANDHKVQPHPADSPAPVKPTANRFVYASGARPLAGYTIKRGVGQGGFGEIYYATSDAGKDVALKLIRRNLDVELRGIHQCLNLKHPNLLALYDIRQDDNGDTWVVMEYVADPSLDVVLGQHSNGMTADEALYWIDGIGAGVAYLHDRGIVHRDLKPANIFIDEGLVKVGDYGLSKYISCSRRSGHTESVGTVHYMAPEVANGRYGKEIDVYAMGVILYELLTGRVPFEGESIGEVLMKHLTAVPDVSMIAEPYRGVIAKALEKDPEKRYRSAAEMLAALPPCPAGIRFDRSLLRAPVDVNDAESEKANRVPSDDGIVRAGAVKDTGDDPVTRTLRATGQKIRRAWNEDRNTRSSRIVRVLTVYAAIGVAVLSPVLIPLMAVLALLYGLHRLVWNVGGMSPEEAAKKRRQIKKAARIVLILGLLIWQYGMLAIPWSATSRDFNGHAVYCYEREGSDMWFAVFAPTAIIILLFVAKWLVSWVDRHELEKSWTGFKIFVVFVLLIWQYGMLAIPWTVYSHGYYRQGATTYYYEHCGAEMWFAVFAPTVILLLLLLAKRLAGSWEGKRPARSWAEKATIVAVPSAPELAKAVEEPVVTPVAAARVLPRWYERSAPAMILKSPRERVTELLGSLLGSALVAALMAGALTLLEANMSSTSRARPEEFGWLWLVGIVGAWAVLIPSKLWEGHRGDPMHRRLIMTIVGMGLGLVAFEISDLLMIALRQRVEVHNLPKYDMPSTFFSVDGQPLPMAYMACFGTLFLVMPWWRQADPLRRTRLKLWMLFLSALVAFIAAQVWQFPQPWLPMAAATISVAVQLASPWCHPSRRRQ